MKPSILRGIALAVWYAAYACGGDTESDRQASGTPGTGGAATSSSTQAGSASTGSASQGGDAPQGGGGGISGAGGTAALGGFGGAGGSESCPPRNDDPTGYLVKICRYLVANAATIIGAVDPGSYQIKSIERRTDDGRDLLWVHLDCCYMGDIAFIDPVSGDVVGFSPGDV